MSLTDTEILSTHLKNINMYQTYVNSIIPTSLNIPATAFVCGLKMHNNIQLPFTNLIKVVKITNSPISGTQ